MLPVDMLHYSLSISIGQVTHTYRLWTCQVGGTAEIWANKNGIVRTVLNGVVIARAQALVVFSRVLIATQN